MNRTYENVNVLFNEHFDNVLGVGVVVSRKRSEVISHLDVVHLAWVVGSKRLEKLVQLLSHLVFCQVHLHL